MANLRQPAAGETISGPLNIIDPLDNGYAEVIDASGVVASPAIPYTRYVKPLGVTAGTPSDAQVRALCQALAPKVAEEIARQSALATRVTLLPQQSPATGFSSGSATYNYTFGSTAVGILVNTRAYSGEKVPVDLVLSNPTLTADMARRLAGPLQARLDGDMLSMWSQFTTNTAQGTAGSGNPIGGAAAALALLTFTGEPVFLAAFQGQMGLTNHGVTGNGVVNEFLDPAPVAQNLALAAAPAYPSGGPAFWVLTTPYISQTGSAPVTTHNLLFTPSAIGLVFEVETNINNTNASPIANCIATGVYGNIVVTVWALNTGAGVQAIYASIAYGTAMGINANGVQVKS